MKTIYIYSDGTEQTVKGRSEKECAEKQNELRLKKIAEGINLVRIKRPRTELEKMISR